MENTKNNIKNEGIKIMLDLEEVLKKDWDN